ncbi:MAG: YfhO family protein [Chloroflexi bacterium]|nr:YfhO family protein [Chloroflexota bacterium]
MRRLDRGLLALVAIVAIYNVPQLLSGSVQFDGVDVHYASQRYLSDELHAGRIPFWTPFIFSGFPFLADLQVAAWYPPNWPFFLVGITPRSIGLELALHELIACSGAYVLAKRVLDPASAPQAVAVAMFYGLSGWFAAHAQHVGMVDTAAWLPWLLLLIINLREQITPCRLAAGVVLGAAIMLPGSFQLALYTFAFVAIWAAIEAIAQRSAIGARRVAIGLAASAIGGALLSAVMILPAFELVSQSERAELNALALPDIGYFHPSSLLTLVYPNFYGLLSGRYTGPGDSTQHYFYAGILLVPLAGLGLRHATAFRTAASLSLPFLWYALGPVGGLYRLLARLPGFSSVELPMHGWFLVALGLALLAGAGFGIVERRIGCRRSRALLLVVLLDVLTINQLLNPLAYARASFSELYGGALEAFAAQVRAATTPVERVTGQEMTAVGYRNHGLQSRVATTYGYNPLELSAYADYISAAEQNPRLIDGLAATHRLDNATLLPQDGALPLAYFAQEVSTTASLVDLDPRRTTLVEQTLAVDSDPAATVTVTDHGLDWLTLRYTTRSQGLVRVAIPMYPGWEASLDDAQLPVLRADHAFIGIVVPPGTGEVRLTYTPRLSWLGALISGLMLLATVGAACLRVPKRARPAA